MKQDNFREYNQNQGILCSIIPAELINEDNPAYIIDRIVEKIDLSRIYQSYYLEGNPPYHPRMMLKVLFYSYYVNLMSSRKIRAGLISGRADYLFLSGGQCPDHRTINTFRTRHIAAIPDLFAQVVLLCEKLGMIGFEHLAVDGQKIQANANFKNSYNAKRLKKRYEKIKKAMQKIVQTPLDENYSEGKKQKRVNKLEKEMLQLDELAKKLNEYVDNPKKNLNKTDIEANVMTHKDGTKKPSYNHQSAVDKDCGVTCAVETLDKGDSANDLLPLVEKAKSMTGSAHQNVSADSAFSSYEMLEEIYTNEKHTENFHVPDRTFDTKEERKHFPQEKFEKNEAGVPVCPAGKEMRLKQMGNGKKSKMTIYEGTDCQDCHVKDKCTNSQKRTISIDPRSVHRDRMRDKLNSSAGRERYRERQWIVEAGHGNDQKNKGWRQHYLRGRAKAHLEFLLIRITSNIGKIFRYRRQELLAVV